MNRTQSSAWFFGLLARLLSERDRPRSIDWCRDNIILPPSITPKPGPFNPDSFPATSIVYDWFDDPAYRELFIVKGSQGALSQTAQNLSCMIADFQLGDIMWVLDSAKKVVELNQERIRPMITESCKSLLGQIYDNPDKLKNTILQLRGIKILMAGARSAGGLASRTIPFVFGDEVDEWLNELQGKESNPVDLLRERAKLIEDAKLLFFSKPRNAIAPEMEEDHKLRNRKPQDSGIIWNEPPLFMFVREPLISCRLVHACKFPFSMELHRSETLCQVFVR